MEYGYSKLSICYHNIFNYPLTKFDLDKWSTKLKNSKTQKLQIIQKNNFYFIKGRQNIIKKRIQNEKYSQKKLKIAKRASELISKISSVKFVGITGALAMNNAGKNSDIDLMIITKQGTLWITRALVYGLLRVAGYELRKPKQKNEKNKLCINLWLDENDLVWDKKDRNIYTAHEIAQVVPLVNKDKTYENFLFLNKWILQYWPYAVSIKPYAVKTIKREAYSIKQLIEKLAYFIQYQYMKPKITREVVLKSRAIFHPNDWGKVVMEKLNN